MSFVTLRNLIVKSVTEYMDIPVVLSDQTDPELKCPFIFYFIVTPYVPADTTGHYEMVKQGDKAVEIRREDPTCVFSFTVCSNNREEDGRIIYGENEAMCLAERLQGWFLHAGYDVLTAGGAVVDSVNNVRSRSFLQVDEEARRWGFDVSIRYVRKDKRVVGTIEKVNIEEVRT